MHRRPLAQINIKVLSIFEALLQEEVMRGRLGGHGERQASGFGLVDR